MRKLLPLLLGFAFALSSFGQQLRMDLATKSIRVLPGTPIEVEVLVQNESPTPIVVASSDMRKALQAVLYLYTPDNKLLDCWEGTSSFVSSSSQIDVSRLPKCVFAPGAQYSLRAAASGPLRCPLSSIKTGPYRGVCQVFFQVIEDKKTRWLRKEAEIMVHIVQPYGEDQAYLDDLQSAFAKIPDGDKFGSIRQKPVLWEEVLRSHRVDTKSIALFNHPTSTYAAYLVYSRMAGFGTQDPSAYFGSIEGETFNSNSYPVEAGDSKDNQQWLKGQEAADWWTKWYDVILKNHPDIWFADEMRLKRAVDRIALKNYSLAEAELDALAKDPNFKYRDKARLCLDLMKQKGWTASKPAPEPVTGRGPVSVVPADR